MGNQNQIIYGRIPRRFRIPIEPGMLHPNGSERKYFYGCYFPQTDLCVGEMGSLGTGMPTSERVVGLEWLDEPKED